MRAANVPATNNIELVAHAKRRARPAKVAASPRTTRSIGAIIVGYRHRRSFGDIAGLAESIEREGLTAGSSRASDGLKPACKRLGWTRVSVASSSPTTSFAAN
jgi:hypothetical protein